MNNADAEFQEILDAAIQVFIDDADIKALEDWQLKSGFEFIAIKRDQNGITLTDQFQRLVVDACDKAEAKGWDVNDEACMDRIAREVLARIPRTKAK